MLTVTIPQSEQWDERNQEFVYVKEQTLSLEHSLVSISKWEAKWNIPFLTKDEKTREQLLDYIKCMTLTQNVRPEIYNVIPDIVIKQVEEYIKAPMTATTVPKSNDVSREVITSELIYYWMIALGIPFECQKWHLNRLLMLVSVCNFKNKAASQNGKPKKLTNSELAQRAALNEARKAALHTKG